jgi:predicted cobalt transporter CbtA
MNASHSASTPTPDPRRDQEATHHPDEAPGSHDPLGAPYPESVESAPASDPHVQTAGAFDIRIFIGSLIGIFGVALTLMGLFGFTAEESAKTDGLNANLWAGLGMILAAIVFFAWTKLQPIHMVVRDNEPGAEEPKDIAGV